MIDSALKAIEEFLDANSKKVGVTVLSSGLQYRILKKGDGNKPSPQNQVTVHYEGKLINGEIFDSSYARNTPATFPVNGVISGWTEALQLMTKGSQWELVIPSHLAYGEYGAGGNIGPHETLLFTIELIDVL